MWEDVDLRRKNELACDDRRPIWPKEEARGLQRLPTGVQNPLLDSLVQQPQPCRRHEADLGIPPLAPGHLLPPKFQKPDQGLPSHLWLVSVRRQPRILLHRGCRPEIQHRRPALANNVREHVDPRPRAPAIDDDFEPPAATSGEEADDEEHEGGRGRSGDGRDPESAAAAGLLALATPGADSGKEGEAGGRGEAGLERGRLHLRRNPGRDAMQVAKHRRRLGIQASHQHAERPRRGMLGFSARGKDGRTRSGRRRPLPFSPRLLPLRRPWN